MLVWRCYQFVLFYYFFCLFFWETVIVFFVCTFHSLHCVLITMSIGSRLNKASSDIIRLPHSISVTLKDQREVHTHHSQTRHTHMVCTTLILQHIATQARMHHACMGMMHHAYVHTNTLTNAYNNRAYGPAHFI